MYRVMSNLKCKDMYKVVRYGNVLEDTQIVHTGSKQVRCTTLTDGTPLMEII